MTAAVELEKVGATYGESPCLRNVSLQIQPGEMVALLGPNGAGKSTLLRVINGLHPAVEGRVRLFGRDQTSLTPTERAALVALSPQYLHVPMPFTVEEVVGIGRTARLPRFRSPGAEHRRAIETAMAWMDVLELRDRPFEELSGGERQRAIVAMALAQEPRLLLLDEPTSHLDINHRLDILRLIARMNAECGLTVLLTSHDLSLAAEFCRRLIVLDHGRVVADGAPAETLREPLLREVYHCELRVQRDSDGGVTVRPVGPAWRPSSPLGRRVHVVCGGGTGAEVFRRLMLGGCRLSAGVLNEGDTDAVAAAALGIPTALEKPFSPIGEAALERARELLRDAEVVILCATPFGPGNFPNLQLAEEALARGLPVWVHDGGLDERDFTPDGVALRRLKVLLSAGARPWRTVDQVLESLYVRGGETPVAGEGFEPPTKGL